MTFLRHLSIFTFVVVVLSCAGCQHTDGWHQDQIDWINNHVKR